MPSISASVSAVLAKDVYMLTDESNLSIAFKKLKNNHGASVDINEETLIKGKTGGPVFIKSRTAFGLCVYGKGHYQGHAFIILRGTRYLADWLTNLNVGASRSTGGQSVHDGFNMAFKSLKPKIQPFVSSLPGKGIHSVHCIGHSLGGALATMTADYIQSVTSNKPYLYTFGAPRVGLKNFADFITGSLTPKKMFRVYHRTDIVPCIPFWPFIHAPSIESNTYDYFQPSPGAFPAAEWHDMNHYVNSVSGQDWKSLRGKRFKTFDSQKVEAWINDKSPVSFTVTHLEWLDKAINYVLSKALKGLGSALTLTLSSTFTLMDQLAYVLKKSIDLAENISGLVLNLIGKIMQMLGWNKIVDKISATREFIRHVFESLALKVNTYCQKALDQVLVKGNAI